MYVYLLKRRFMVLFYSSLPVFFHYVYELQFNALFLGCRDIWKCGGPQRHRWSKNHDRTCTYYVTLCLVRIMFIPFRLTERPDTISLEQSACMAI